MVNLTPFPESFSLQYEITASSFKATVEGASEDWDEMSWKIKFNPVRIRNHAVTAIVFAILKILLLVACCILGVEYINCANYILFLAQSQDGEYFQPYDDVHEVCDTLPWLGGTVMLGIIATCSLFVDIILAVVIFCDEIVDYKKERMYFTNGTAMYDKDGCPVWNVPGKRA